MKFPQKLMKKAEKLLAECSDKNLRVVTAESCTGGLIAVLLTEVPGSSDVFEGAFITYANEAKEKMLKVPAALIKKHGAVSEAVARTMAEGALKASENADISVAVTGIAGPTGGTKEKPVGLVHIASSRKGKSTLHKRFVFKGGRQNIRMASVEEALALITRQL